MCHGEVTFEQFETNFAIDFNEHFAPELGHLEQHQEDGLLVIGDEGFKATPEGRLLLRNIAVVFDAYLQAAESEPRFSRVI